MKKNYLSKIILLFLCFAFFSISAEAYISPGTMDVMQNEKISGIITDINGEPLIGVSVIIKGSPAGTATDIEGKFYLETSNLKDVLVISYIGYVTQEIKVSMQRELRIVLKENTKLLEEVVVVGYGTQRKATLSGSVDAIPSKELNLSFNSNTQNMLTGKLSGVSIRQNTSEPGAFSSSINIRGMGEPLIVIDGVISSLNIFNRMTPTEIESVSILKDASASVYGMKAANGVLLVTTKKGANTAGKPTIEYSANLGFTSMINLNKPMDAYQYAIMRNEINQYKLYSEAPMYSEEQLDKIRTTPGLDVYNTVFRKSNPATNHTINVSGSAGDNNKVNYFLSGDYLKEDGLYRSGSLSYQRYNLRSNISADLDYGLNASVNLSYIKDKKEEPNGGNVFGTLWFARPIDAFGNVLTSLYADEEKGYYLKFPKSDGNALAFTDRNLVGYLNTNTRNIAGQLALSWDIPFIKGFKARFNYSFEEHQRDVKKWKKKFSLYEPNSAGELIKHAINTRTSLDQTVESYMRSNYQATLNYDAIIAKLHNLKLLVGFEQMTNDNPLLAFSATRYFQLDSVDELFAGSRSDKDQSVWGSTPFKEVNQSFIGRINYDYAGKYLLEGSFRYDGSSAFAKKHRWGFFPSVSLGWRLSEEGFIKNNNSLSFIDNIKVRASYGKLGDDSGTKYNWAAGYLYPEGSYIFDDVVTSGLKTRGVTNEKLTWYTSDIYNLGLDFDLWGGLLSSSAEIYKRNRDGLLATRSTAIPWTVGASMPHENLNSDMTIGWELQFSHRNKIKDFNYSISGNINLFRTKNKHVERAKALNSFDNWRNNTNNRWNDMEWGHVTGGQITNEIDGKYILLHSGTSQNALTGPGDYWHLDLNGDGWVTEGEDLIPIYTNKTPKLIYGFTLAAEYKGIDLSAVFNGAAKFTVTYEEFLRNPLVFEGLTGALEFWTDRWRQDEMGNWIPGKNPRYRDEWAYVPNVWTDSRRIRNASYLRLKNIEIGYSLPKKALAKVHLQRVRFYANAYNLLTFSNIKEMDPEAPEQYRYPMARNFNFGVNVTF
ncbi:SusC/RagA family TonB-linked outer membrane protein [Dysgonomonas sp.]